MTEDIRILRNALARYREFVEVPAGDPLEVPLYLYKSAKEIYAEACDPDRIRRILDDAERYQWLREEGREIAEFWSMAARETSMTLTNLDRAVDKARKS